MKSYETYALKLENSWPKGILEFPWVSMPDHLFRSIAFITSIGDIAHVAVASFRFFWNLDLPGWQRRKVPCMTCNLVTISMLLKINTPKIHSSNKSAYINPKNQPWTPWIAYKTDSNKKTSTFYFNSFGNHMAASHGRWRYPGSPHNGKSDSK